MRRVGVVLAISALALAVIPGPARAQAEPPSLGCIPTSDNPFQTGLVGDQAPGVVLLLVGPPYPTVVGVTNPGPIATFPAGIAPGTYAVVLFKIPDLNIVLGSIQIANCTPPTPTSKEQCKNGGWRTFPDSKNGGQCIKFVQHGPNP